MAKIPQPLRRPAVHARRASRKGASTVGSAVVPLGVAGGILTAVNEVRKQGGSMGDAALYDGIDTAKSFATYGAAHAGGAYALMRTLGMGAARANVVAGMSLMAYGAVDGALDARKEGTSMLKGAAKGAWEFSLPGMIWEGGKETIQGVKDYRAAQVDERKRFEQANAHWQQPKQTKGGKYKDQWTDSRGRSYTRRDLSVRKGNPDWDLGIDPKAKGGDE